MIKVVSRQYGLSEHWDFHPPVGIRLVDVRTIDELEQHADEWNELFGQTDRLSPLLSYPWMHAFFKYLVHSPEQWLCLFAYENDRLIGILPLVSSYAVSVFGFSLRLFKLPYHFAHTSGTDCIARAGHEDVFGLFMNYLNAIPRSIPCLSLKHVPDHYASVRYLTAGRHRLSFVQKPAGTEGVLPLPADGKTYLSGLSAKLRRNLRHAGRELDKLPEVRFRLFETGRSATENTRRFLDVESRGWKGERKSAVKYFTGCADMFEDAAAGLAESGLMEFSFLESGDRTLAAHYAMRSGRTLYILKMAYDEACSAASPGNLLMLRVIQAAADSGRFDEINFVSDPPLLAKWNVQHRPLHHLVVFPDIPLIAPLLKAVIASGKIHSFDIER
jgi:hypothetical protein